MIKLVSQFDNENSRPSLATPTCAGCCCCCCCCLITTVAAASISARNFANFVEERLPNDTEKIEVARRFGFFQPIGFIITILSVFWVALSVNALFFGLPIVAILYLIITTRKFNEMIELKGIAGNVIGATLIVSLLFAFGVVTSFFLVGNLMDRLWIYFLSAIAICGALVFYTFKKSNKSIEDQAEPVSEADTSSEAESTNEAEASSEAESQLDGNDSDRIQ